MPFKLYLDESGDCSFSEKSACKHFLITLISVEARFSEIIKKRLRRQFAKIIKNGWDKYTEIKAYTLYYHKQNKPVEDILKALMTIESLRVHYIVVNKDKIKNESFRNSSYGIGYNYFTKIILSELIFQDDLSEIDFIYDLRNKETHAKKHFKQYLETEIFGMSLEQNKTVKLSINGLQSDKCYGLMAVDFCSWGLYRHFEHGDDRFLSIIKDNLGRRREWYLDK
jgi:hypothetical protein